jgi:hypothetical protein
MATCGQVAVNVWNPEIFISFKKIIAQNKCESIEEVMRMKQEIERQLLDIKETCIYLGVGETKARELIRGHNGFGVQIGNRWYAHKKKLDSWLENNLN